MKLVVAVQKEIIKCDSLFTKSGNHSQSPYVIEIKNIYAQKVPLDRNEEANSCVITVFDKRTRDVIFHSIEDGLSFTNEDEMQRYVRNHEISGWDVKISKYAKHKDFYGYNAHKVYVIYDCEYNDMGFITKKTGVKELKIIEEGEGGNQLDFHDFISFSDETISPEIIVDDNVIYF